MICYSVFIVAMHAFVTRPVAAVNDYLALICANSFSAPRPAPGGAQEFSRLTDLVGKIADHHIEQERARGAGDAAHT